MQVAAGAIGVTCQKLGEAEVMAQAGIAGLLISNQIVGAVKIQRLIALARQTSVIVAVDAVQNVADLSDAATTAGVVLKILIEVDTGMKRCGVATGEPTLELARYICQSPGLELVGVMGFEGHVVMIMDPAERQQKARQALQVLVNAADLLRQHDIPVPIVSSSGTGTFDTGGRFAGITELQVGSYATMDGRYRAVGVPFECALTLLATVMSGPRDGVVIADVGIKSITTEFGLPEVVGIPGAELLYLSEEHAKIKLRTSRSILCTARRYR
jgi:D-serine deaminase-like pyridoxal phosphate-dependent protein